MISANPMARWSPEQLEVWSRVQDRWKSLFQKDSKGAMASLHPRIEHWDPWAELPINKNTGSEFLTQKLETAGQLLYYHLQPASIQIFGDNNVAVVLYISLALFGSKPAPVRSSSRQTDTWLKQEGEWVMIGHHSQNISRDSANSQRT
jgi:hypothetical protein